MCGQIRAIFLACGSALSIESTGSNTREHEPRRHPKADQARCRSDRQVRWPSRAYAGEEFGNSVCGEVADPGWKSMILFGLCTGQRLGDAAGLTWANIDLPGKRIRPSTQKTGKVLIIHLQ
jgi:integrase